MSKQKMASRQDDKVASDTRAADRLTTLANEEVDRRYELNELRKQIGLRFDAVSIPTSDDVGTGYRSAYLCRACSQEVGLENPLEHVCPDASQATSTDVEGQN